MDAVQVLSLVVAFVFLIPGLILIQQYRYTKVKQYLIFSSFFTVNFLYSVTVSLSGIDFSAEFDESLSDRYYVSFIQLQILLNLIVWSVMFYIGYRILWPNGKQLVRNIVSIFALAQLIFILLLKVGDIPSHSKILFLSLTSQLEGRGAYVEIFPGFYFGQGHVALILIWNVMCVSIFAYSFYNLKNPFNYEHFSKIRSVWLIFAYSYIISQIFQIIALFGFDTFRSLGILIQLIGIISVFYAVIVAPEGLLLDHVQILNAVKIYGGMDKHERSKKFPIAKVIDYIEYMKEHV